MLLALLLLAAHAEKCSERSVSKFPVVFADCERWYDECDCLRRKEVYLREKQCEDHPLFAEVAAAQAERCTGRKLRPSRGNDAQVAVCTTATTSAGSCTAAASTSRRWGSGGT